MAKFTKEQKNALNLFLKSNSMHKALNDFLKANKIRGVTVESIKLKPKTMGISAASEITCPQGFHPVEVCTIGGRCEWRCKKN
jgi:hypothetical protein